MIRAMIVGLLLGLPVMAVAVPMQGAMVAVPVLKAPVDKGTMIDEDMLTVVEVPAVKVFASTFTQVDDVVGQQAVRPLPAGEPLNRLHVRLAPAVERGSSVTVRYARGGVEVTAPAKALEDGKVGQSIRLLNPDTRTTLVGVVSGPATVSLN